MQGDGKGNLAYLIYRFMLYRFMPTRVHKSRPGSLLVPLLFLILLPFFSFAQVSVRAQENTTSRLFAETGRTVGGKLLAYWNEHGGLPAQGLPISEQMQEKSETDGRFYTVQYFERAVLELHPENTAPYDVLPSLLGVFQYKRKYSGRAPNQHPNNDADSRIFAETGKRLGGGFLAYWLNTGGLVQYGYPISDEFTEVSDLSGKSYTVQYFERVVFEYHPENEQPYRVLLSQLGTFYYRARYAPPAPSHLYGLVGQGGLGDEPDADLLQAQYDVGVRLRLVQLGWNVLQPGGSQDWNEDAARALQARVDAFTNLGSDSRMVLDFGIQYPPQWAADTNPLVDQFGNRWAAKFPNGGVNVYWSAEVRRDVAGYIRRVFQNLNFHGRLWAVRVGIYGGELLYPEQENSEDGASFWAFDNEAQAKSPVPGWKPGRRSPNGEALKFYRWYVDDLVDTFSFFLGEIRHYYQGYVAPVTPGIGMSEQSVSQLVSRNLVDNSLTTYGTGNYWPRIFSELPAADKNVINWCSSLGDGSGNDSSSDIGEWSSAHIQAYLARQNGRQIFGENSGRNPYASSNEADPRTTAQSIFQALQAYGYVGIMWLSQQQMNDPKYTSLAQYKYLIAQLP